MVDVNYDPGEPVPPRPPLLRHVKELLANPAPLRWLIHGLVEDGTLSMLFGPPAAGKSFVSLSMAASIATGVPWYGHPVRQGGVVYLAGEGHGGLARRLKAWATVNPDAGLKSAPLYLSSRVVPLIEDDAVDEISSAIQEAGIGRVSLVVIDTLHRASAGADENSSRDMGEVIAACDRIREKHNCVVLLVHHSGHGMDRARGSSSIRASLDFEAACVKDGEIIKITVTKAKESAEPAPLHFRLVDVGTGWFDEDGQPIGSAVLEPTDVPEGGEKSAKSGLGGNQRALLTILRNMTAELRTSVEDGDEYTAVKVKDLRSRCKEEAGIEKDGFRRALESLEEKDLVITDGITIVAAADLAESVKSDIRDKRDDARRSKGATNATTTL